MLILLMVPFGVILIPLWTIAHRLHITNTYLALILPPLANPLGVFLMRQFILALPRDLENAARLDGVSRVRHLPADHPAAGEARTRGAGRASCSRTSS